MTKPCLHGLAVFLLGACLAAAARADVVAPEVQACNALSAGASCSSGTGTCQPTTCYGNDWTHWDPDAGPVPPQIPYDCLTCAAKNGDDNKTNDSSGCAVGGRFASTVAPWLLAGAFGAGVLLLRRRPRR